MNKALTKNRFDNVEKLLIIGATLVCGGSLLVFLKFDLLLGQLSTYEGKRIAYLQATSRSVRQKHPNQMSWKDAEEGTASLQMG